MAANVPFGLESAIGESASAERWNLNIDSQGRLTFNANALSGGNTRMVIDDDTGNVGIGTATPQAPLHIYSPNTPTPCAFILLLVLELVG